MDENKVAKTFEDLGVEPRLLKAIGEMGFESPMPIQEMVIPHLLEKDGDVVGLAQTGTGKTAAFGLPVLQRIDVSKNVPQALIIAPTRELCLQIAGDLADFSKYIDSLRILPVYGGSSIDSQIRTLRKGVQVVVATPGRLIDLIKRGEVKLSDVHTVILDEADEMLNMGFLDDIKEILTHVPEERKMLMFSATMPKEIAGIAKEFMHEPVEFVAGNKNEGSKNVRHIYYMVKAHDKYLALKRIADNNPDIYGIIFCRTRKETQEIADKLINDGYNADCLHGDLSQAQRDLAMKKFRDHVTQLLVATDVAARGLDVDDLTHVINYGLPDDVAVYTHRSGRTGRANKTGVSVAIIHSKEKGRLREIEKKIGKEFEYKKVPTPEHIIEKQLYNLADRLERVQVNESEIEKYLPGVRKKLEWLSEEDLLKRVLSLEFNRLLQYYQDMPDIDLNASDKGEKRDKKQDKDRRVAESGYERIMVNVGKAQGFFPGNLMEIINRNVVGSKPDIGRIDLLSGYTLFDVRKDDARRVIDALKNEDFFGIVLRPEIASDRDYSRDSRDRREKRGRKSSKEDYGSSRDRRRKDSKDKKESKSKRDRKDPDREKPLKKEKKEKKEKKGKAGKKAEYNGNYEIFYKKK
ncbi:DEAD/DEAH box helicase [Lepagella muris]|uniref:DEAD/DEAH box helicase n=1 Tax=Lepagella muris TaxID=3032870 RepID=A0AC61RDE2_9BACT|nr:DEAD/DEAH box helicase [Lepagella muris]ROT07159.1 DEAD/DEAH box helicase [Muribaculaceae bacterium Isolate-037 (Harlan)]TGY76615.1 DEAD/DEAH box helicase [Lepagella muris]THG48246.1 DEAD/DEAH box helicase [Bacteroidales bacterium]TKC54656.1 DEAD/DEAH box helicase [Bacteroidales bacterium]